jgi:hypothetical protein
MLTISGPVPAPLVVSVSVGVVGADISSEVAANKFHWA